MIWFFERGGDLLRCEIRIQIEGDRNELVITHPDGRETVESFTDNFELNRRREQLQRQWKAEGWDGPFSRDW